MIKLNITNKIVLLAISAALFLGLIISSVFVYIIHRDQQREIAQLSELLRHDYDNKIKEHTEIITSLLEQIDEMGPEYGLSEDSTREFAAQLLRQAKYGDAGYFWADKSDGQNVFIRGSKTEGTSRWDITDARGNKLVQDIINAAMSGNGFSEYWWPRENSEEPLPKRSFSAYYEPFDWIIGTGNYIDDIDMVLSEHADESQKALQNTLLILVAIFVIATILIITISIIIGRRLSNPIIRLVSKVEELGKGKIDIVFETQNKDEIGQLAKALNNMLTNLRRVIETISTGSGQISNASSQLSSASENLSQGASEQASSIEEVSSTMEEISSNIDQNTQNAQQTNTIASEANEGIKEVAQRAGKAVEANQKIADKITIINDIAFQTNILALNAAVEAARAGAEGRGFSVVASEVRKLAERSKVAAEEIVALAKNSLDLAQGAGEVMMQVIPKIEKTTQLIQEITAASLEQNSGAGQVNTAIQELNSVTQQNAASSEELATSAEELSSQADHLKEVISFFHLEDSQENELAVTDHFTFNNNPDEIAAV